MFWPAGSWVVCGSRERQEFSRRGRFWKRLLIVMITSYQNSLGALILVNDTFFSRLGFWCSCACFLACCLAVSLVRVVPAVYSTSRDHTVQYVCCLVDGGYAENGPPTGLHLAVCARCKSLEYYPAGTTEYMMPVMIFIMIVSTRTSRDRMYTVLPCGWVLGEEWSSNRSSPRGCARCKTLEYFPGISEYTTPVIVL